MLQVKTSYKPQGYTLETDRAMVKIGAKKGEVFPYDMLLGALSSCFYYTLLEIFEKRNTDIPVIEIVVTGQKREKSAGMGEYGYHRLWEGRRETIFTVCRPGSKILLNP